jgi:CubicO group peptidase (beta-lactamase class C family)
VVEHGVTRIFSYGAAKPDSIYEIGSITKTFTGLVLSQMVEQGEVRLDEPVRELLPAGTVGKPDGSEITLLDLATHHSGLPRMPDNVHPADPANPFADYRPADLYAYLARHTVAKPAPTEFLYSNLGFGLLGQALSNRAAEPYAVLLEQEVAGPLGLKDTAVSLSPEQQARFIPGHSSDHRPARAWDSDALEGAGAIRSSAPDMLRYLQANLHPDDLNLAAGPSGATLAAALIQSHQLRGDRPGGRIALAWFFSPETGDYSHEGETPGYSSYAFFNPKGDFAAVVLSNTGANLRTESSFADRLAQHIEQRLTGKSAISLAN